ncbi:MAG: OmpH family outer membrane protein [Saprospiraceae bacterium]
MKFLFSLCLSILLIPMMGFSQKFGYVNTQDILSKMAEVKIANIQLDAYEKELASKGEEMVLLFENEYKLYMNEVNSGNLSKVQMMAKEESLMTKQEEIKQYEQEAELKMEKKQQDLYEPILMKIRTEIDKLGKEGNYTMIFDSAQGILLHAEESENLLATLKTRLGIPN